MELFGILTVQAPGSVIWLGISDRRLIDNPYTKRIKQNILIIKYYINIALSR